MNPSFPWRIAANGRTAVDDENAHVRAMIEQLLLTNVGERVNRPDFGGGVYQLIFAPNGPELAATLQLTLQAAVQRYLADVIDISGLTVASQDSRLLVQVAYRVRATAVDGAAQIELPVSEA